MKSYNHLFEQVLDDNVIREAADDTLKRIRIANQYDHRNIFNYNFCINVINNPGIMKDIILNVDPNYIYYRQPMIIYDGIERKQREIIIPEIYETILQKCMIKVLMPALMRGMYYHSYASIPGRGTHAAANAISTHITRAGNGRQIKYCLKMDIKKFFNNINQQILYDKLNRIIRDDDFMRLILFTLRAVPCGLPLGFYSSQWFANFYLQDLDHYIKEQLHANFYVRYMDDMVIFGSSKRELHRIREEIEYYLNNFLSLQLKDNWQVFRFDYGDDQGRALDFIGYRFYRNRTILRKKNLYKITRKCNKVAHKSIPTIYDCQVVLSSIGQLQHTNTYELYNNIIKPNINFNCMKKKVANHSRLLNNYNIGGK